MSKKVFLVGIDGGTFDVINPLIEKGELPHIGRLMREGTYSNLTSTFPPTTIPAWPTVVTGVNPGKLGINSFIKNIHVYDPDWLISMDDIKVKSLWHYLENSGKKSIIVNIPYLYPPQKINGIMVSYFNTRSVEDRISACPETVARELFDVLDIESLMQNRREFGYLSSDSKHGGKSAKEFWFDRLVAMHTIAVEKLRDGSLHLMTKYDWDFFMVVFNSTDFLQHRLWSCFDKESPAYDGPLAKAYGDEIFNCYKRVDNAIGEIRKRLDGDTTTLIMSDHGFSPLKRIFYVNQWLKEKNLLFLKGGSLNKITFVKAPLYHILTKLRMLKLVALLPEKIKRMEIPVVWRKAKSFSESIDWSRTKAYAHSDTININLKGREPMGIVEKEEYEDIVDLIKKELYDLRDSLTGEKIIDKVFEKKEIYHGPFVENASDIYFFFNPSVYRVSGQILSETGIFRTITKEDKISGVHQSAFNGIFIGQGPEISAGASPTTPHLMDITPTILYLMGMPVSREIDGRVLTEIIDDKYLQQRPVQFDDESVFLGNVSSTGGSFSHEDSRKVKNLLKDLGYFD